MSDVAVSEGQKALHAVTLSGSTLQAATVQLSLTNGTATGGADFSTMIEYSDDAGATYKPAASGGTATINAGVTSFLVRITTFADALVEPTEKYNLYVTPLTNIGTVQRDGIGSILDAIGLTPPLVVPGTWVVIGSSTAAGGGATAGQAWAARLQADVSARGVMVTNLAMGGTTTYEGLPVSAVPVPGRPLPLGATNIDAALSFSPELVFAAYPTNDTAFGYSVNETVTNLLAIRAFAQARGAPVIVLSTQPRNLPDTQRALLAQIDAELAPVVGPCFVDVRGALAAANGSINPLYDAGDGVHVNDAGHAVIFAKVKAVLDGGACVRATPP